MAISPIDYTSGNGFGQGLQLAGLYHQVQQQKAAADKAQADQEALKAFQSDWQSAYGDPDKMDALVAKYPGQIDTIKNAIGFQDDNHRMALGNAARDLRVAMASNNPQAIQQAATQHAKTLSSIGSSPQDVMEQLRTNPQGLAQTIDAVGMSALGAKDFYGVQNDRANQQVTMRGQDLTAETARRGQDITVRGQNISAQNSALDREIRRSELQEKALDRQLQRETDSLKRTELEQKIAANNEKLVAAKEQKRMNAISDKKRLDSVTDGYSELANKASALLNNESLWRATGVPGNLWNFPGSEAANIDAEIASLKHQIGMQTLTGMKELSANGASGLGNASNREYEGLQNSLSSLDSRQSPSAFRASLKRIIDHSNRSRSRLTNAFQESYPDYQPDTPNQQTTQQQQLSDDALVNKYLGGR